MDEHLEDLDGQPRFWRSAPADGATPVFVHGVPTNSDIWLSFLERMGGVAPDLPGFGRSGKRGDGEYTIAGYDRYMEAFLDHLGLDRIQLVVQDWGGAVLAWAQRQPERVERLVIIDAVPLLPGYRWHRIARAWRTPLLGEIAVGALTPWVLKQVSRESNATKGPMPQAWQDLVNAHYDQGTQRAILKLYRSSGPKVLAAAGRDLGRITCPALVAWGATDPYIPARFAEAYAAALGGPTEVVHLPDAGHWAWYDRPDLVETVATFLGR